MAGKGGWHRFGLSGAPLPGSQLQGRNRNFSQLGMIPPWGNEAKSGDVWSLQLVGDAEQLAGKAPAQNLPAPGVSGAKWGDAGLTLPRKPTHLAGPMWGSPVLEQVACFLGGRCWAWRAHSTILPEPLPTRSRGCPVSSACQAYPPGPKVRRTVRAWSHVLSHASAGRFQRLGSCLPGEDGGGCLVPKPQGLEDAGPRTGPVPGTERVLHETE